MYSYPMVIRPGPRSLHFRGRRPIPRLPELAHAAPLGRLQRSRSAPRPGLTSAPGSDTSKGMLRGSFAPGPNLCRPLRRKETIPEAETRRSRRQKITLTGLLKYRRCFVAERTLNQLRVHLWFCCDPWRGCRLFDLRQSVITPCTRRQEPSICLPMAAQLTARDGKIGTIVPLLHHRTLGGVRGGRWRWCTEHNTD